jgi:MOSC domain-containing protein YiiM
MPKEGIFARVICSGLVRAGDPVEVKVQTEDEG